MATALTIAGSDSGGGAGIQTDLKTFASLGVYGTSVITALTAQNTRGVHGIHAVPPDFITCQFEAVLSDIPVHAAKTGMLGDSATITAVAKALNSYPIANLVVDPVMVAQSGHRLLANDAVALLRDTLFPLATVVTPNLHEAAALLGREICDTEAMAEAAKEIHRLGPRCVLVKGGHLEGDEMTDILYDGSGLHYLTENRIDTVNTHGTGCTYAAAIAAYLALGLSPLPAVRRAKSFITSAITYGLSVGKGAYGPTDPMGALLRELAQRRVLDSLRTGYNSLLKCMGAASLLAEGSSLFCCLDGAISTADVASVPASREKRCEPSFAGSSPAASLLLEAHKADGSIRAMINLLPDANFIRRAISRGWKVITPDKENEPLLCLFGTSPGDIAKKLGSVIPG